MKIPVIALAVICVLLGFALYQRGQSTRQQIDALLKDQQSLSNQVTEARTRLALEQGTAITTRSNLQHTLDQRTASGITLSNRLVQTHLLLQSAQGQVQGVQKELLAKASRVAALEVENQELQKKLSAVASLEVELRNLRRQVTAHRGERDAVLEELDRLRVDQASLMARLSDVKYLQAQLEKAKEEAELRLRMASARAGAAPDPKMKLELQPDGTVRYAVPR